MRTTKKNRQVGEKIAPCCDAVPSRVAISGCSCTRDDDHEVVKRQAGEGRKGFRWQAPSRQVGVCGMGCISLSHFSDPIVKPA